tara:strand:+ start:2227 stop:3270 length:1044 start_codon:yes stop_codon:yes gene_type:complete
MSEIKLKKESMESEFPGVSPDIDENNVPFNRLTFTVKHPINKGIQYWELNKNDSKSLLTEKEDGVYAKEEDIDYLRDKWAVEEFMQELSLAWRIAEKGVDIPEEWWEEVNIIPKEEAMYDEVFVNKQIVKVDYSVGCTGKLKTEYEELKTKIKEKFPNEYDFFSNENNIIGKYNDNHTIRPPYKSQNTITVYHMYYPKSWLQKLLKDYQCPNFDYQYKFWFGLKYDLDLGKRYLKIVISDNDVTSNYQKHPDSFIPRPQLPVCDQAYFAKIYSEDGTEADEYDVFFSTTPEIMKAYCTKNELDFPIPESREDDYIWTYGLVYDKNTLKIKQVKGYVKVAQNISDWLW